MVDALDTPTFFQGLATDELAGVVGGLEHRRFARGATVLAEGDLLHEMYVVQTGIADIFVFDASGTEHDLNHVGPGGVLGEMSLLTGQPASATVRANTALDVLVLDEAEFERIRNAFPDVYRNVGAILAHKLFQADRRTLRHGPRSIAVLEAVSASPRVGFALASSIAWHTRRPSLLIVLTEDEPAYGRFGPVSHTPQRTGSERAELVFSPPTGEFAPERLAGTVEQLGRWYDHVLVEVPAGQAAPALEARSVRLHDIPPLDITDDAALASGLLPATTPAGRALGRVARDLAELKVGLALGAGGMWGYAHVGVLRELERIGLTFDFVAGASIGSGVAALFAMGYEPGAIADTMDAVGRAAFRPTLPIKSLSSNAGLRKWLQSVCANRRIEDLPMPLALVAADLLTARQVVLRTGLLWQAVLASMSIPGVYPPLAFGPHLLVDGAVLNPVPGSVAAAMGADVVIAVKLVTAPVVGQPATYSPGIVETIYRAMGILQNQVTTSSANAATITIEVTFASGAALPRNFAQGRPNIEVGEAAAAAARARLAAALPWLRP